MEIIFLGTSGSIPTADRNQSTVLVKSETFDFLMDCGEGTQRQFKVAGISPHRLKAVFITHWHADHTLGLPGLLQTLDMADFKGTFHIFGPEGTELHLKALQYGFHLKPSFVLEIHEIKKAQVVEFNGLTISIEYLDHRVPCIGYRVKEPDKRRMNMAFMKKQNIPEGPIWGKLQDGKSVTYKGKKISAKDATTIHPGAELAYVTDTLPCAAALRLAKNVPMFICEATFGSELAAKAKEFKHMTGADAGSLAKKAKAESLVLTHFSQRYKRVEPIVKEAKAVFSNTQAAHDFLKLKI